MEISLKKYVSSTKCNGYNNEMGTDLNEVWG